MGSAGLEWDANDGFSAARGNQKTVFVGTTAQRNALGTTYPGQLAYLTDTDTLTERNAANNAWNQTNFVESAELSNTPTTDNADFTPGAGGQFDRYYEYVTLPSTYKIFEIVGIEWKNGATVNGVVVAGVDLVDADPPTIDHTPLIALAQSVTQSGTSVVQRVSIITSNLVRAGTILGVWFSTESQTSTFRRNTAATSKKHFKGIASSQLTPAAAENTVFAAADTNQVYLKLYYRGLA